MIPFKLFPYGSPALRKKRLIICMTFSQYPYDGIEVEMEYVPILEELEELLMKNRL